MLLDSWHKAAADAKYDTYFEKMTKDFHRYRCNGELETRLQAFANLILIKEGWSLSALNVIFILTKQKKQLGLMNC
jgi:hypothetical protein